MTPKGGVTPHTKFRVPAKKAEVLFTDHIAEHLTADGRGGVIVPNGIVATTQNAYVKLRRFRLEDSLVAVVSLPGGVFKPYSGVKTSILLLDKKLARQTKEILFLKITADGFDLGDKRNPIEEDDLPGAQRILVRWMKGQLGENPPPLVPFVRVERSKLFEPRSCTLQVEPFLGNGSVSEASSVVRLAGIVATNPGKADARALPSDTDASFVPMEGLLTNRPDFIPTRSRRIGDVITGYTCLRDRDVLRAKIAPCFENGKAGIAAGLKNGIGFGSTEFYVLRTSDKILPEFLYHIVKRQAFRDKGAENMAGTAGQQRVRRDFIEDYEIPLPSLEEQRRIVAEIEGYQNDIARLESEITANRERIQTTIDTVWTGDSESANGAPPSQPGATPQVSRRKPTKG
jgi:type I restriction enzyme M protein